MASKAQRAVPDVTDPEAWRRFGRALRDWREDVLGYDTQVAFAADRGINLKLVRSLENGYKPGASTKASMQKAARAWQVTYGSMLAFLRGEADRLVPAGAALVPAVPLPAALGDPPVADPARRAADEPYARPILGRLAVLAYSGVPDPRGEQMFPDSPADAWSWDDLRERRPELNPGDRAWVLAYVQRSADARRAAGSGTVADCALVRAKVAG